MRGRSVHLGRIVVRALAVDPAVENIAAAAIGRAATGLLVAGRAKADRVAIDPAATGLLVKAAGAGSIAESSVENTGAVTAVPAEGDRLTASTTSISRS